VVEDIYAKAVDLFQRGADLDNAQAQYNLGFFTLKGRGTAKSKTKAVRWFEQAAAQGHAEAQQALRRI
jgi:TPR repeat protein